MKFFTISILTLFLFFTSFANIAPITVSGDSILCVGGSLISLNDSTSGGVWSSSDTLVAIINTAGQVSGISSGVATISYFVGASYQTKMVVVKSSPLPIFGQNIICQYESTTLYDTTAGGGTWVVFSDYGLFSLSLYGPNYASISNTFIPATWGDGDLYFIDTAGCRTGITIWAYSQPFPPITGDTILSIGSTTTLNCFGVGTWISTDTSVASIGYLSGIVTGISSGTTTISYTYGCIVTSDLTVLPPVAIPTNNVKNGGSMIAYPNPATTSLTITSLDKITTVAISNIVGQTVYTHQYNSQQVQVDVSALPAGIYFVKVNGTDSNGEVRKFVKE